MEIRDFKKGDRLLSLMTVGSGFHNQIGTVLGFDEEALLLVVEFDKYISSHEGTCNIKGKNGHCWNFSEACTTLLQRSEEHATIAPERVVENTLTIPLLNGLEHLGGKFRASNGDLYNVSLNKVPPLLMVGEE